MNAPGFSFPHGAHAIEREDIMKRERMEYRKPYGRGDYELVRGGEGVYWQAGSGLMVRMAAADHSRENAHGGQEREFAQGEALPLEVWSTGPAR
jgi:hypothetical protein